jgi:transposase
MSATLAQNVGVDISKALSTSPFIPPARALASSITPMVKAGKPAQVAIVAIMRKLFILANALIRDRRKWTPIAP